MRGDAEGQEVPSSSFVPVCAIGASAGGVAALQGLFRLLPDDLGLAYVIILHLSPDHPSALSEILSTHTRMPVVQIDDAPSLRRNCVFVIPPDRELVIEGDNVAARPFTEPRGRRAPIDMFFRSVAAARGDGIAVILSGAGSDGTVGLRAVKEAGGVIMVQEPAEAGFGSMPQNAIATGDVDFVAPLARLAELMAEVARSKEAVRSLDVDGSANDLRRIVAFLRARTGHDFSSYKRATVMRRVMRRMQVCRTETVSAYADYLLTTPEETKELFSDLLISVTMFFRDQGAFAALERLVIGPMFDDMDPEAESSIRAWVVGCATGEEAYSLGMLLLEEATRRRQHPTIQIFATDLDEGALATAREGRYPLTIEADVSEARLARFFTNEGTHYRVRKELRDSVLFAKHSAIKEPPFMRLDLITCRNLLIYLERSLQQQLCTLFHYGLKPGRFLFLGSAETADSAADLFAPLDREARIYSSRPHTSQTLPILPQFAATDRFAGPGQAILPRPQRPDLPGVLHLAALEESAPPSALVDEGHAILHLSPTAGLFIQPTEGPLSNLLPTVVHSELRLDLQLALTRVFEKKEPTLTLPVNIMMAGGTRRVGMHVIPVSSAAHMGHQALVLFLDGGAAPSGIAPDAVPDTRPDEVRRLHAELKASQEALIASRVGHEAAVQDLRATNEELQSINEEYRSTAEELETSKEELQSINEELHTVNAELKSKLGSISVAHSDLQNLTMATEIGTLFLDAGLRIKMFTPPVADLFNVTTADIGRTITDFTHRLEYEGLESDARRVLCDLTPVEMEIRSKGGRWYTVRLRPYRTVEDRIDGTVATFVDITARWEAEAALRASEELRRVALESGGMGTWRWNLSDRLIWGDAKFFAFWGLPPSDEPLPLSAFTDRMAPEGADEMEAIVTKAIEAGKEFDGPLQIVLGPTAGRWIRWRGRVRSGTPSVLYGVTFDITEQKRIETALRESQEQLRQFGEASLDVLWIRDAATLQWEYLTPAFEAIYGIDREEALRGDNLAGWAELILPEDREYALASIRRVGEGERMTFEYRIRRPADGEVRWLRDTDFPMRDAEGRVRRIGGVGHDVTALKEVEAALAGSEARLRALVEGMPQLVWRSAAHGEWTWASSQWTVFTGLSDEASRGHGWLAALHPDDQEGAIAAWDRTDESGIFEANFRLRRVTDGVWRWFQARGLPVPGTPDNGTLEWVGTSTDIDDQVRARTALERTTEVLEARVAERTAELMASEESLRQSQKMEAVGQLTGGIAHDFNNMLQGVAGGVDMARRRVTEGRPAEAGRYLEAARAAVERAAGLTRRLLAFARRQRLEPKPVDADALVAGMADLIRRAVGPGITLELRLHNGAGSVLCDPNELENVLLNLCINGRDAMPDGGRLVVATEDQQLLATDLTEYHGAAPGSYVVMSVADTGSGMSPEVLARVFEPFFTTKPVGEGTGLGLSQVWGFVRQSDGFVRIESTPGGGTKVHLLMPRTEWTRVSAEHSAPSSALEQIGAEGAIVLLVDDEAAARSPAAARLRELGYRVLEAADGPTALRLLIEGNVQPDLLVSDVGLPNGMNGRQVAEAVRERIPGLPVLFITGYAGTTLPPGVEVLGKPFALDDLALRVQALLAGPRRAQNDEQKP